MKKSIKDKIKRRLRAKWVSKFRNSSFYFALYRSYWHKMSATQEHSKTNLLQYFSAIPNPGAGVGHQLANWIAGYWYARQFGLAFAHIPFSTEKWDRFLGLGEDEPRISDLEKQGYKIVRIPLFDEQNEMEIGLIKKIIASYRNKTVVFVCEQDQFYRDQFGVMEDLQRKFYAASDRKNDQLIYNHEYFNVAVHVRRGDIVIGKDVKPNLQMRFQENGYFVSALKTALNTIQTGKPIAIYLFSQGKQEYFSEFEEFENIHFCLDMEAQDSFLHMVYADALITSKSSFSYKPALLNKGLKFCPKNFWHGYPKEKDWILLDDDGMSEYK